MENETTVKLGGYRLTLTTPDGVVIKDIDTDAAIIAAHHTGTDKIVRLSFASAPIATVFGVVEAADESVRESRERILREYSKEQRTREEAEGDTAEDGIRIIEAEPKA